MSRHLTYIGFCTVSLCLWWVSTVAAPETDMEQHQSTGLYHVGLWVTDLDEMLYFLTNILDFKKLSENERAAGGTRTFLGDARGQYLELLAAPDVKPHPAFPLHPLGRTAGVAHIAIRTPNTLELRKKLISAGYEILQQVPADDDQGYVDSENGEIRIIFVRGPSDVSFEFMEFKHENDLATGHQIY